MTRLVIKLGTQVVVRPDGRLNTGILGEMAQWVSNQSRQGVQIVLVTSGAVGLGRPWLQAPGGLGFSDSPVLPPLSLTEKQACAAIGQPLLMATWQNLFSAHRQPIAQVLVSARDMADRGRYLSLQDTLTTLMTRQVVPIVNENDALSAAELLEDAESKSFGDNDQLSALLAAKLNADLLVILTNVNGLYTDNPQINPNAQRILRVTDFSQLSGLNVSGQSSLGRGGMQSKVQAVRLAALCGVTSWIAPGWAKLDDIWTQAEDSGTWVDPLPPESRMSQKAHWIGYASGYAGSLTVNAGAAQAIMQRGASLLAVGVSAVRGSFLARQVISLQTDDGTEVGRGLCDYGSSELVALLEQSPDVLRQQMPVVHRNNLVCFTAP